METKQCISCHNSKLIKSFTIIGGCGITGFDRDSICDSCKLKYVKKLDNNSFIKPKGDNKYKKYNITTKEYNFLFNIQDGRCKICNTHQTLLNKKLVVDHCHKTGHVRGLLCNSCNSGLGFFKDNRRSLERAIEYLKIVEIGKIFK